jgi:hypothetical protein
MLFMKLNGVHHRVGAPFHPQTNGLAERLVQSVKSALKKMDSQPGTLEIKLWRFLLSYRSTTHGSTGKSPAVAFLGRPLRTRLDVIKPRRKVEDRNVSRVFTSGQAVMVRDFRAGAAKWQPGIIEERIGTYLYKIRVGKFSLKRHADQILLSQHGPLGVEEDTVGSDEEFRAANPLAHPDAPNERTPFRRSERIKSQQKTVLTYGECVMY